MTTEYPEITTTQYGRQYRTSATVTKTEKEYTVKLHGWCQWKQQTEPTKDSITRDFGRYVNPNMNARI